MGRTTHPGGCMCGAVRFEATGAPRFVANCHCHDCRRATGAAFSTWVGFKSSQLVWSGAPRAVYERSPGVRRGYCARCGTPLSYEGARWPGEIHLTIGSFDTPDAFTPSGSAFADEALAWVRHGQGESAGDDGP